MKDLFSNRYHRDGTVTFWSVYTQTWRKVKADQIRPETLATMNEQEREKIRRLAAKQ